MKTLSEQIKELLAALSAKKDQLVEATKALQETPDDATEGAVVELTADVEKMASRLESLQKAEKALGTAAQPVGPVAAAVIKHVTKSAETENLLGKLALITYEAKIKGINVEQVAETRFKGEQAVMEVIKAAQNPAASGVAGYAQELTQMAYGQFLDTLRETTVLSQAIPPMARHTFDGNSSIYVPYRAGTSKDAGATFRAEGAPIPVKGLTFSNLLLTPKNMGVILTATEEMLRRSSISLAAYFQSAMVADTAEVLDALFLDATAGSAIRPAGIQNGIAGGDTRAAAGTGTVSDIVTDVKVMVGAMTNNRMGSPNTRWLMSNANKLTLEMSITATGALSFPTVAASNTLAGYGIIDAPDIPDNVILLIDFANVSEAFGSPMFTASTVATLHEESASPLPLATGTSGAGAITAAPVRSLFQTNSWALRMMLDADWAVLRPHTVQQLTAVAWVG
jgi:HK97 family phage major capsid protein